MNVFLMNHLCLVSFGIVPHITRLASLPANTDLDQKVGECWYSIADDGPTQKWINWAENITLSVARP